jgi:tetratricopeptide (TPR) repeat protein
MLFTYSSVAQPSCDEVVQEISTSDEKAIDKLRRLNGLTRCSETSAYNYKKAILLASLGEMENALSILSNRKNWGEYQEHSVLLQAKIYAVQNNEEKGIKVIDEYLVNHRGGADLHYFKGKMLNSQRKFKEALSSFIASATIAPGPESYQAAAVSYYALAQCDKAIDSIDQAAALDDRTFSDLGSMVVMSRCYAMQGKFVVATNALKMLLQNNPKAEQSSDFQEALSSLRSKIKEAKKTGDKSTDAHLVELRDI